MQAIREGELTCVGSGNSLIDNAETQMCVTPGICTPQECCTKTPVDCEGNWSNCNAGCTKEYNIISEAVGEGLQCPFETGDVIKCTTSEKGGDCTNCPSTTQQCDGNENNEFSDGCFIQSACESGTTCRNIAYGDTSVHGIPPSGNTCILPPGHMALETHTWTPSNACSDNFSTTEGDCIAAGGIWNISDACSDKSIILDESSCVNNIQLQSPIWINDRSDGTATCLIREQTCLGVNWQLDSPSEFNDICAPLIQEQNPVDYNKNLCENQGACMLPPGASDQCNSNHQMIVNPAIDGIDCMDTTITSEATCSQAGGRWESKICNYIKYNYREIIVDATGGEHACESQGGVYFGNNKNQTCWQHRDGTSKQIREKEICENKIKYHTWNSCDHTSDSSCIEGCTDGVACVSCKDPNAPIEDKVAEIDACSNRPILLLEGGEGTCGDFESENRGVCGLRIPTCLQTPESSTGYNMDGATFNNLVAEQSLPPLFSESRPISDSQGSSTVNPLQFDVSGITCADGYSEIYDGVFSGPISRP